MNFLTQKTSEVPFWQILLGVFIVTIGGLFLYNMVSYDNIVETGDNGSLLKRTYFAPMSLDAKQKYATAVNKRLAPKPASK